MHIFDTDELQPITLADGLTLWGAAHRAPANTRGFLGDFRVDRGGVHLGLFHGSARGSGDQPTEKVPHAPFRAAQIRQSGLYHALLGHFHHPVDAPDHTYPGNPDPLTFGESWPGEAVLVTIADDGAITRRRLPTATSTVGDIDVDITGVTHAGQARQKVLDALTELSGHVRVTLHGALAPDVDLRAADIDAACPANLEALVTRFGTLTVALTDDYEQLATEQTVRGQFVRDVLAADTLSDDQRHRVLLTGLRALDERAGDLEVH